MNITLTPSAPKASVIHGAVGTLANLGTVEGLCPDPFSSRPAR
jgi:hypothetical protein